MADKSVLKMKAVEWDGKPYHMSVKQVIRPQVQDPSDAVVKITTAAICGSDLHNYHGILSGSDVPYIMGHEAAGIVHEVGSAVTKIKVGDRVVVPDFFAHSGEEEIYGEGNALGTDIGGCQAEYVRTPSADTNLWPIPAGTEHELDYLTCSDIFATGWISITQTGFQAGDTVAVYGAGPVGLLAAYSALLRGALRVYSIDHVDSRLARAKSIGAIPIDLRKGDPSTQIFKLEPSGVNRASDCVGMECVNPQLKPEEGYIVNDMIKVTATGGGVALTGVYWNGPKNKGEPNQGPKFKSIPFDIGAWWIKGITISGGIADPSKVSPVLIEMITAGRAKPGFVFDHVVRIDEAPEAYRLFSEHKIQKAAIKFDEWTLKRPAGENGAVGEERTPSKRTRTSHRTV